MEIEVVNFSRHNPRATIKRPVWFALSNRILEDPDFFDFTDAQFKAWIYILCQASQKNSSVVIVNFLHAQRVCGIEEKTIVETANKLEKLKCIQVRDHGMITTCVITTQQYRTEQDTVLRTPPVATGRTTEFIAAYCRKFKARWGVNPEIKGKNAGIAKRLATGWSGERAEIMLDAFFSMPDAQLVKAKHPLTLLEYKLNEVTVYADSGKFTTNREAHQADTMATNVQLLQKIREGKI